MNDTTGTFLNFKKELVDLINEHNVEELYGCNVPDFILAQVCTDALRNFALQLNNVKDWYEVHLEPCGKSYFKQEQCLCTGPDCGKPVDRRLTKEQFMRLSHDIKNMIAYDSTVTREEMWERLKNIHGRMEDDNN